MTEARYIKIFGKHRLYKMICGRCGHPFEDHYGAYSEPVWCPTNTSEDVDTFVLKTVKEYLKLCK